MRALRALIGPVVLGAAAWCASGTIAVARPTEATLRYASPAAWWVFVLAAALAALVPAIRRRPTASLVALLSTMPWWPVPLPPIGLLFTGPLAWLPIAAAVVTAIGAAPLRIVGRALGSDDATRAPWLAGCGAFVLIGLTAWSAAPQSPGGDEPHYLVITQSLLKDGDIRIENNHRQGDYKVFYGGDLAPHYIVPGKNGQIYSVHAPGLSTVVLPGFALFGYHGAEVTMMLLAALTAALVWRVGWRATGDPRAAWFAWAALVTSTTFLIQGFTIYPDGAAMIAVAVGALLLLRLADPDSPTSPLTLALASIPLAALPWLHTRFSVIAAGFGAAIALRLLRDPTRAVGARLSRAAAFVAIPAVAAASWFVFFYVIYGTFNPTAPYGTSADTHVQYVPGGIVAMLFDGQFGLTTYAPVFIACAAGWWSARGTTRRAGVETLAVLALYLAATTTYWMWWAGRPAPPARFFAAMLPVLALPLSVAWANGDRTRRTALLALVAVGAGFAVSAIGGLSGAVAWNDRDGQSRVLGWLGPLVNLRRAWPSFFWTLSPDFSVTNLASEWHFAGHVLFFVGVFLVLWLAARRMAVRATDAVIARTIVAVWLLGGLIVAAQTSWLLRGVTGLDAEPAQAEVLADARQGDVVAIDAFHISRQARFGGSMTVATEEPGKVVDPAPWFVGTHLPAGDYDVDLHLDRPVAGTVVVGADGQASHAVEASANQSWPLHLSKDDATVVVVPDEKDANLRAAGGTVVLRARWGR